jgi:hypothetical protein
MLFVSVAAVVALTAGPAAAAGTLDQSYEGMSASGSIDISPVIGQTFTAGTSGNLDQIEFAMSRESEDASATVELRTTNGGLPTETVLASAAVPATSIPADAGFVTIPIGPVPVTAGTKYAIVVTGSGFRYHGDVVGNYAGGDAVSYGNDDQWRVVDTTDLAFRTYVTKMCKLIRISLTPPWPPIVVCI